MQNFDSEVSGTFQLRNLAAHLVWLVAREHTARLAVFGVDMTLKQARSDQAGNFRYDVGCAIKACDARGDYL